MPLLARAGRFSFRYRGFLLPIAIVLLLLPSPALAASSAAVGAIGFLFALAGQFVRVGTIGMAYIVRGGRNHQVHAESLVTEGAYAHCRNPMYLGNLLLLFGLALASNSQLFAAVALPLVGLMYVAIVAAEEDFLGERFGPRYVEYRQRTPRWLPRLRGLGATFRAARFDWRRVLRAEYSGPFDWLAGTAVVVLANLAREDGLAAHAPLAAAMATVAAGRLLLWTYARRIAAAA